MAYCANKQARKQVNRLKKRFRKRNRRKEGKREREGGRGMDVHASDLADNGVPRMLAEERQGGDRRNGRPCQQHQQLRPVLVHTQRCQQKGQCLGLPDAWCLCARAGNEGGGGMKIFLKNMENGNKI